MLYYLVGNRKYHKNVDALRAFSKDAAGGMEIKFDYRFTNTPSIWRQEPPLSVFYYMDQHARVLSERHTKVYLRYSGGTDSHSMLESFVRTKNPVDLHHIYTPEMGEFSRSLYIKNKPDFQRVSKLDVVKDFKLLEHKGLSSNQFDKALNNYTGHLNTALQNTSYQWDMSSDKPTMMGFSENDAIVSGKEKPMVIIKDGWWHWITMDSRFGDTQWNFEKGYGINFFMTDDVPELQIKMTYNKIHYLEQVARKEGTKIDSRWLEEIQSTSSVHYRSLNHAMGLHGLNQFLDSVDAKLSDPREIRKNEYRKYNDRNQITNLLKEYTQDIVRDLRDDLYLIGENTDGRWKFDGIELTHLHGILHASIPIKPIADDLL
jgi:hypothetical protein